MADLQRRRLGDLGRDLPAPGGVRAAAAPRRLTAADAGRRVDAWLAAHDPDLSRSQAARLIREGRVALNGRRARPADSVAAGDRLEYEVPEAAPTEPRGEAIPLRVVYEDADLVVVDKPAGMVVHPAPGHHTGTLVHALLGLGGGWSTAGGAARPGIVHRLDAGTTGLILAARNDRAHRALAAQLADRTLSRTYRAIVLGALRQEEGVIEAPIGRDPHHRQRMAVVERGRPARTRYRVLERRPGYTLVEVELETGRTHQIRVHLSAIGHPLVGDLVYGGARAAPVRGRGAPGAAPLAGRPMLHAYRLRLRHPRTNQLMTFETAPPDDFTDLWNRL